MREMISTVFLDESLFPTSLLLDCLRAAYEDEKMNKIINVMNSDELSRGRVRAYRNSVSYTCGIYSNISKHLIELFSSMNASHRSTKVGIIPNQYPFYSNDTILNLAKSLLRCIGIGSKEWRMKEMKRVMSLEELYQWAKAFSCSISIFLC